MYYLNELECDYWIAAYEVEKSRDVKRQFFSALQSTIIRKPDWFKDNPDLKTAVLRILKSALSGDADDMVPEAYGALYIVIDKWPDLIDKNLTIRLTEHKLRAYVFKQRDKWLTSGKIISSIVDKRPGQRKVSDEIMREFIANTHQLLLEVDRKHIADQRWADSRINAHPKASLKNLIGLLKAQVPCP